MPRVVQVHVCTAGGQWERDHLLFPAYLRAHRARADAYAELKRDLAEQFSDDRIGYAHAKGSFVEETLRLAELWAQETGWLP